MGKKRGRKGRTGNTDLAPVIPPPEPSLTPSTSTNIKTWREYLIGEGLVSEQVLERKIKAFPMKSERAKDYRDNLADNLSNFEQHIVEGFNLEEVTATAWKVSPHEAKIPNFEVNNEPTLKVLSGRNCYVLDGTDKREILAVKVATNGPPGVDTPIIPVALRQSIEDGIYRYLCSNPCCKEDATRHRSQAVPASPSTNNPPSPVKNEHSIQPFNLSSLHNIQENSNSSSQPPSSSSNPALHRPGGPANPVPPNLGRCHHIHAYTAAQLDKKIKNIKLGQSPSETWNGSRDRINSFHQFLDTMKPLTTLVQGVFKVTNPDMYNKYDRVYKALPKNNVEKEMKDCLGIWTSRGLVLDTMSDIHLDLRDVCKGFCAIIPFGPFEGGNICLPRLGISIPVGPGMLKIIFHLYFHSNTNLRNM
ncbi:hypothetical protein B9Z19DRAFT_1063475 [Tuber borchii]|uniref:Uncharacterized protein n=1 Tax=Tuber borchii TaxID=42251 RepID=A0A2T6ZY36_TUBBO|nr:hypothetical protein B9Z19DRAFT_1063475 [Tuber borchii]